MSLTIQGLGTALPPEHITQGDAAAIAAEVALPQQTPSPGQRRLLQTLHRRSGVASRHSVLLQPAGSDPRQTFFGATSPGTGECESSPHGSLISQGATCVSSIRGMTCQRIGQFSSAGSIRLKK